MSREVTRTIEELERQMNRERVERNRRLTVRLEQEQLREKPRKRHRLRKWLFLLALVALALLAAFWSKVHIVWLIH